MSRAPRGPGSGLRLRVRRRRWPRWSGERPESWRVRGLRECGRLDAGRPRGPGREAGRATEYRAERDFPAEGVQEALSLTTGRILPDIGLLQEPFCLRELPDRRPGTGANFAARTAVAKPKPVNSQSLLRP